MLSGGGMNHAHFYREKGSCDGRFLASGDVRRQSGDALERAVSIFCPIPARGLGVSGPANGVNCGGRGNCGLGGRKHYAGEM